MTTDDMPPRAPRQHGPKVWLGSELARAPAGWSWTLSPAEVEELVAAARSLGDLDPAEVAGLRPAEVPLPSLRTRLELLRSRLRDGLGFELIRGFPAADVPESTAAAAFIAIGVHLGSLRSQNAAGDLLGHVRDVGRDADDPTTRIYQTNRRQTFHTDSTDVVGLLCLETAASGGASLLVSVPSVYNAMLDREPDLARLLFEPIATDWRGEEPPGSSPFFTIPVLSWFDGELTVLYQRQYIESARRFPEAPPITDEMVAALDLFDELCDDPEFHLAMDLEVGDMQFVYNHALLHDRTGFVDRPERPRHLLRLWVSLPGDRRLPPCFAQRYGSIAVGDRGGIRTRGISPS